MARGDYTAYRGASYGSDSEGESYNGPSRRGASDGTVVKIGKTDMLKQMQDKYQKTATCARK